VGLRDRTRGRAESKLNRARKVFKSATLRSSETNLETTAKWLGLHVTAHINGEPCALLPFRRKTQQSSKSNFVVHAPSAAPNVQDGVLSFSSTLSLKLEVPANFDFQNLESVQVFCKSQRLGQRRPTLVFNATRAENTGRNARRRTGDQGVVPAKGTGQLQLCEWFGGDFRKSRSSAVLGTRLWVPPSSLSGDTTAGTQTHENPDATAGATGAGRPTRRRQLPRRQAAVARGAQTQLETVVVSVHLADVLESFRILEHRCAIYDDLDPKYGLHDLRCTVSIRSFGVCWWEQTFRCLSTRDQRCGDDGLCSSPCGGNDSDSNGFVFDLLAPAGCVRDVTRHVCIKGRDGTMLSRPELYIRSATFADIIPTCAIVDVTVWDEHGGVLWSCSRLVHAQPLDAGSSAGSLAGNFGFSLGREEAAVDGGDDDGLTQGFCLKASESGVGCLEVVCAPMVQDFSCDTRQVMDAMLVVRTVRLVLQDSFIDSWFKTKYSTAGAGATVAA
jgi:hypothetical protein